MIELAAAAIETTAETSHLENVSPFADSLRPNESSFDSPQLKDSELKFENHFINDSERPKENSGIIQPQLKHNGMIESISTNNVSDSVGNKIPCRNENLAGKEHSITGVPFEKKSVVVNGEEKEVVVPKFDSAFDAKLPEDKLTASDTVQFKECNSQLKEAIDNDSDLKGKFDDEQIEQIENGDTPDGYTWHHDAETGKIQLVDTEIHAKTAHTGGRNIWGGGTECR